MIIQIDGTGTVNKGAELMLYAILEEIEQKQPKPTVLFNKTDDSIKTIQTKLNLIHPKRLQYSFGGYVKALFNRLNFLYFTSYYPEKKVNVLLDGSGFRFGDQWNISKNKLKSLTYYYSKLKQNGTKIILLSQALGPFETNAGKQCIQILNSYADLIIARDPVSLDYYRGAGGDMRKTHLFPDFTAAVKGTVPKELFDLKGRICIIPNRKMIQQTGLSREEYVERLEKITSRLLKKGHEVFLLNHEGKTDLEICNAINSRIDNKLKVVSGLNAKEIKGVIGNSFFVLSGRYHGVASALNQGVPCMATSWSHKYEYLFKDFDQKDCIIDLESDIEVVIKKINSFLTSDNYNKTKTLLESKKEDVCKTVDLMWENVWECVNIK